jgi:hypothetical protein
VRTLFDPQSLTFFVIVTFLYKLSAPDPFRLDNCVFQRITGQVRPQLTLPGSRPFHLQATLVETTNPKSQYQAKIEEFWLSPTKWRRTIESPGTGGGPASEVPTDVFFAAYKAVTQWRFHPYVLNGKAQYFHATVTFPVK